MRKLIPVLTILTLGVGLIASQLQLFHTQDELTVLLNAEDGLVAADAKLKKADGELKAACFPTKPNIALTTLALKPGKPGECLRWNPGWKYPKWGRCDGAEPLTGAYRIPITH